MSEKIQEQGIVVNSSDGFATVSVIRSGSCEACNARIICQVSGEENPRVIVRDPLGARPGDRVRIAVAGRSVLSASLWLYGIPLAMLLLGIALGATLFVRNPELYGSLLGLGLCTLYYFIVRIVSRNKRYGRYDTPIIVRIL